MKIDLKGSHPSKKRNFIHHLFSYQAQFILGFLISLTEFERDDMKESYSATWY